MKSIHVSILKNKLGYLKDDISAELFDKNFSEFLKSKQIEKNLQPTGIIDSNTWYQIYEQPYSWQKKNVESALKNWNTIIEKDFHKNSNKMIIVNIPSMKLYLYEKQKNNDQIIYKEIFSTNIIVGKKNTQTPIVDFDLISLKYNPNWTPTPSMLSKHIYKKDGINIQWLKSHNLDVYNSEGNKLSYEELSYEDKNSQLRFVQPSGDGNALGNLKFETTSKDNIYLHDTNEKKYFSYNIRTYSSGCIRVHNYINLASMLSNQSEEDIQKKINTKKMFYEKVERTPIYIDYSQVYFLKNGKPIYFFDVYGKN